jgi:uncharacterized protein
VAPVLSPWRPRLIVLQPTPYCNINCEYCYLQNRNDRTVMPDAVIRAIRDKIFSRISPDAAPTIVWHAGEPTVAPISWYENAYAVLRPASPAQAVFSLQSNGVFLPDDWIAFLERTETRIGLSIDGPQKFHDARRKTRAGGPTWSLVMRTLKKLQSAGFDPTVISVLHPSSLDAPQEYFSFYRDNEIHQASFSIDETEGANLASSFDGFDFRPKMVEFLRTILKLALSESYPLYVKEIERIAHRLVEGGGIENEQVEPWQVVVVGANGDISTFSPEFMELRCPEYNNFCFGNILRDDLDSILENAFFVRARDEIAAGVEACQNTCRYFGVCGGGAPANKMVENGSLRSTATSFCSLSIQAAADALLEFISEAAPGGQEARLSRLPADGWGDHGFRLNPVP